MKKPSVTPGGDAAPSRAAAPDLRPLHDLSDAPVAEAALERWRDRCVKAIETGNGIPTVGHLWWRRVDPAAERSVAHAIELSDGTSSSVLESTLVHGFFAALAMRMPGRAKGYEAALLWLREELARDGGDHG